MNKKIFALLALPVLVVALAMAANTHVSASAVDEGLNGTFTPIDIPGSAITLALDINDQGMIVGRYLSGGRTHGFLCNTAGDLLTIDFPGSSFTVAASINNRGDIVGQYALPAAPTQRHGFLLKDGVFSTIDPPGSTFTNVLGINERGDVVGRFCTLSRCRAPGNGDFRGFLLRDGEFTMLDIPGAIETDGFKINDAGQIAGGYANPGGGEELFVWRKNELETLALPNGKPVSLDNGGFNARGDLVGVYCDGAAPCLIGPTGTHGFLISDGQFHTIDYPGAAATAAIGINSRRDIVGAYSDANGQSHGFLLSR